MKHEILPAQSAEPTAALSHEERLAAVRAAKSKREADSQRRAEEREIAIGELVEHLENTVGGVRGVDFEVVSTIEGIIGIKRVDATYVRAFDVATADAVKKGKPLPTDALLRFTMPAIVSPSAAAYREKVIGNQTRPGADGIAALVAVSLQKLHGNYAEEEAGKL